MKRKMIGIITTLVVVTTSLAACSKASTTNQLATTTTSTAASQSAAISTTIASSASNSTATTTTVTSSVSNASGGSSLSDLVIKAKNVAYYSCQITVTSGTSTETITEWVENGNPTKFRMEITAGGQTEDTIFDGHNYYLYTPASNSAVELSAASAQQYAEDASNASTITQYNPVSVGPATLNGMDCTVYQYTNQGVTSKIWIWDEYGLPVQIVTGATTVVYSNFSFTSIDASMFELPSGDTIITIPTT